MEKEKTNENEKILTGGFTWQKEAVSRAVCRAT